MKKAFERRLDFSGIVSVGISNEEECYDTKHADVYKDENFYIDKVFEVAKVFLGKKRIKRRSRSCVKCLGHFEEEGKSVREDEKN